MDELTAASVDQDLDSKHGDYLSPRLILTPEMLNFRLGKRWKGSQTLSGWKWTHRGVSR
jgi:hypothetical protein